MTHDRLPTLEEVMNGNPFELIDSPFAEGKMERWRANAMATGTMGYLAQVYEMVRNDAAALEEKTAALDAKKSAILGTVNRLLKFMSRVDALTSRIETLEAKHKADEAAQREFEEELELPPDFDRPQDLPPTPIGDETHQPGGELHSLAAKEEEEEPSELPEPPQETEANTRESDAGKVPLSYAPVPLSYVGRGPKDAAGDLPKELEDPPDPVPLAIGTGDHQLPMVRAEARARPASPPLALNPRMIVGSTADVALFYGLAIGTSAKCAGGQGWRH